MGEGVTKTLREQMASMTTRDWLVRVSELRQGVESRDRVIAEQRRTIERLRKIADDLRKKVEGLEAQQPKSGGPKKSATKLCRKADATGESGS